jgi:hypothetical protein
MNLLTPSGYKNINDVNIGDELIAYDIVSGDIILNHLEQKYLWTHDMLPAIPEQGYFDENGDWIITEPAQTSQQVFDSIYGEWKFYKINNTWTLFHLQSVWANMNITNASLLQIGDIMYNGDNNDVIVTSIEEINLSEWWRLEVSGDSSYISEDLTLHNASRYWVGGGSSTNWNATTNTNWSGTSGGANNASVPTSVDDVLFDALGNSSSVISATITILSINISSGYTATMTHNAVLTIAGNVTLGANYTIAGTSGITISAASTITSNGKTFPNNVTFSNTNTKTLVGNFTILGSLTISNTTAINKTIAEIIYVNGLVSNADTTGSIEIRLIGGTWSGGSTIWNYISITLDGNVTLSGTIGYYGAVGNTFKYISGTITTTGSTIRFGENFQSIDLSAVTFNNVQFNGPTTRTLVSDLNMSGSISSIFSTPVINATSTQKINCNGITGTIGGTISGTADINLLGGTWGGTNVTTIASNLNINGNVTITGFVPYSTRTIKYISGTLTLTGSTIGFTNCTIDLAGVTWNNIQFYNSTYTLNSQLVSNTIQLFTFSTMTFAGAFSWTCNTLTTVNNSTGSVLLVNGLTYTINTSFNTTSVASGIYTFQSNSGTIKAKLVLGYNATCSATANFTRIDASGGRTINTWNGVVTDSINVRSFTDLLTTSKSFV